MPLAIEFRTAMQTSMYVARSGSTGVVPILGDTAGLAAYEPCIHFFLSVAITKDPQQKQLMR